eukprot:scaffold131441_cov19-Tisochrysis_lutea.AAC.1
MAEVPRLTNHWGLSLHIFFNDTPCTQGLQIGSYRVYRHGASSSATESQDRVRHLQGEHDKNRQCQALSNPLSFYLAPVFGEGELSTSGILPRSAVASVIAIDYSSGPEWEKAISCTWQRCAEGKIQLSKVYHGQAGTSVLFDVLLRFPVGPIAELPALKRIAVAHQIHHGAASWKDVRRLNEVVLNYLRPAIFVPVACPLALNSFVFGEAN